MKFVTAQKGREIFIGVLDLAEEKVLPITKDASMLECVANEEPFIEEVRARIASSEKEDYINLEEVTLLAPIMKPTKNILCVGKNYKEHVLEMGSIEDIPEHIMVFTKAPTTIIGHKNIIENHTAVTNQLDYEGELAVVIGKRARNISKEDAFDYVFGYTIINDITARDLQARHKQFFIGKSLDTTCPMGPYLVHKSLIPKPNNLNIVTRVNGEVRQNSNTKHFIFPIEEVITTLSKGMTLEPGDIIATGTPSGVGKGFNPPRFLKPGDQIAVEIESIGVLENSVAKEEKME